MKNLDSHYFRLTKRLTVPGVSSFFQCQAQVLLTSTRLHFFFSSANSPLALAQQSTSWQLCEN